jgi:hypothetical protein
MLAKRDASGWSPHTSLVVLVSASLRVFFWAGKRFGTPLLLQALASIATQLAMTWVVVRVQDKDDAGPAGGGGARVSPRRRERSLLNPADFWKWGAFDDYLVAYTVFLVAVMVVNGALHGVPGFVDALGGASLGVEALLPVPQAVANWRRRSTEGMSRVLIGAWVVGDAFKTVYAVAKGEPAQFAACGAVQLAVDCVILAQMAVYGGGGGGGGGSSGSSGGGGAESAGAAAAYASGDAAAVKRASSVSRRGGGSGSSLKSTV